MTIFNMQKKRWMDIIHPNADRKKKDLNNFVNAQICVTFL